MWTSFAASGFLGRYDFIYLKILAGNSQYTHFPYNFKKIRLKQ